jgi:lipopolysaccharide export system permease protein
MRLLVLYRLFDRLFSGLFGTVQRMLFGELIRVFILCLIGLSGIFTLLAVLQQLQFGTTLEQVVRMLPLLIPISMPWIVPPACLFASCVVYGRMAHDNEAVALKAAGVNLYTVIRPAIALGIVASVGTAALQFTITPYSWRNTKEAVMNDPEEAICLALKKERMMKFPSNNAEYTLYVRDVEDRRLLDVVLKRRSNAPNSAGVIDFVARTREARLKVDLDRKMLSLDGGGWAYLGGSITGDNKFEQELPNKFNMTAIRAELQDNPVTVDWFDLPALATDRRAKADTTLRLKEALQALPAGQPINIEEQIALATQVGVDVSRVPLDAPGRVKQIENCQNVMKHFSRLDRIMRYEYHLRPAIAFGCLFFALLGCPVGLWANRADYLSIFVICFLPALVVYYPVLFMAGGFARDGKAPMALGVWTANAVLGVAACFLAWRLIRR